MSDDAFKRWGKWERATGERTPGLTAALAAGELSPGVFRELDRFPKHVQRRALDDRSFALETLQWARDENRALRRFQTGHMGGASIPA